MGVSQLLGGTCPAAPPEVYAYDFHVSNAQGINQYSKYVGKVKVLFLLLVAYSV